MNNLFGDMPEPEPKKAPARRASRAPTPKQLRMAAPEPKAAVESEMTKAIRALHEVGLLDRSELPRYAHLLTPVIKQDVRDGLERWKAKWPHGGLRS